MIALIDLIALNVLTVISRGSRWHLDVILVEGISRGCEEDLKGISRGYPGALEGISRQSSGDIEAILMES